MGGLFDDLPNEAAAPGGAPVAQPGVLTGQPVIASAGLFDDLPTEHSTGTDLANLAANGFAFGFGDRINAAGDTAVNAARGWLGKGPMEGTSPDYAGNLQRYQDETAGARERHPYLGTAAEIAGGLANPAGYALAPEKLAATLAGRIGQGAALGAGLGAVQGVGGSQDLTNLPDVARNAGLGAAAGGFVGGGVPLAAKGAGMVANRISAAGREAAAPLPGMGKDATDFLLRKLEADGPDAVRDRLQQLGPDAMLLDAGRNLQGAGLALASQPGQPAADVVRALNIRGAGTNARVGADVDAALGPAQNASDVRRAIGDTQAAITGPLYQDAYGQGQRWTPGLDAISQRPAVQSAIGDAATAAANKGAPLPSIVLDEQGRPISSHAQLEAFEARTRPALDGALSDYLGGDGSLAMAVRIMEERRAAADPLYAQFRAGSIPMTPELREMMGRPSIRAALPGAERLARDEGKSIYVKPPGPQWEPDPFGSGTTPDAPADMTFGPTDNGVRGAPPSPPNVPRPQTLHQFVRSMGGVQDPHGDLTAMGLADIPGLVVQPGQAGLGQDAMRQVAAEQGYLGAHIDNAMSGTSINDFLDAMASEHPIYSVHDQAAVDAWNRHAIARDAWEQQGAPNSQGARPGQTPLGLLDMGGPPQAAPPPREITPEGWDYVQRSLGDQIDRSKRAGAKNDARVATGLKNELLQHLDAASPVFAEARQTYASQSALLDALAAGRDALRTNITREQMAADFGDLGTGGERRMYRLGAAHALREQLAQRGDRANFVDTLAGNQALRDKLSVLAPSPDHLARFNAHIGQAQQQFTEATRPTVQGWHDTLQVLDNKAAGQSGPQQAGTQAAADALRGELGQIPSFARAQQIDADYGRLGSALDQGGQALRGGPNAIHPSEYAAYLQGLSPAEQAAHRVGMRADIDRSMGVRSNDHQAVKSMLQGDDGWNGQKIGATFGPDAQEALNRTVDREGTFAASRNRIVEGSKTQPAQEATKDLKGEDWEPWVPFKDRVRDVTIPGLAFDYGLRKPLNAMARAVQSPPDLTVRNAELANAFTLHGDARSALLDQAAAKRLAYAKLLAGDEGLQRTIGRAGAPSAAAMAKLLLEMGPDDQRGHR